MARTQTKGTCALCGKMYARAGMTKHLQGCLQKTATGKSGTAKGQKLFLVLVADPYSSDYWLHLKVAAGTNLKAIDTFLRNIWLECCGHMSSFMHGRQELGMGRKVDLLFRPGLELDYIYDFGSSTELRLMVIDVYEGAMQSKKPVELLARNEAPLIPCDECGSRPAEMICDACNWEGEGWLCKPCAEKHECADGDEDLFLPIPNSPRAGVCGYTG